MKLYPSQIETCNLWLRNGRMKTKRLRKKFWSNPLKYIRLGTLNSLFKWHYPDELFAAIIPEGVRLFDKLEKTYPIGYNEPILIQLGKKE